MLPKWSVLMGCTPLPWEFPGQDPGLGRGEPVQGIPQQLDGRSSVGWGGWRRWGPHPSSSSSHPASAHPSAMGGAAPAPFIIICGQVKCAGNSCSARLSAELGGHRRDGGSGGLCVSSHRPGAALGWSVGLVGDGGADGGGGEWGDGVLTGFTWGLLERGCYGVLKGS